MIRGGRASLIIGVVVWFTTAALAEGPLKFRDSQFEPIKWSELAGWMADDHLVLTQPIRLAAKPWLMFTTTRPPACDQRA